MKIRNGLLAAGLAVLLAPAALAAEEAQKPAVEKAAVEKTASEKPAKPDAKECEMNTGSRIRPQKADGCKPVKQPYRTYTQEELQRTGSIDLGEALRQLDPIFR